MNAKTTKILSYISLLGWLIAFLAGDKDGEGVKQHLNQALIINIVGIIPIGITQLIFTIFAIWGIVKAAKGDDTPLPIFGGVKIFK